MKPIKKNQSRFVGFQRYYRSVLGVLIGIGLLIGLFVLALYLLVGTLPWSASFSLDIDSITANISQTYQEMGGATFFVFLILVIGLFVGFITKK